jgi:hypothetical protein
MKPDEPKKKKDEAMSKGALVAFAAVFPIGVG